MSIVPAIFFAPRNLLSEHCNLFFLSLYSFLSPLSRARTWFLTLTFLQRSATRPLASRVALSRCRFHELESDQRDVLHFTENNSFIYPQVHDSGLTVALASQQSMRRALRYLVWAGASILHPFPKIYYLSIRHRSLRLSRCLRSAI